MNAIRVTVYTSHVSCFTRPFFYARHKNVNIRIGKKYVVSDFDHGMLVAVKKFGKLLIYT